MDPKLQAIFQKHDAAVQRIIAAFDAAFTMALEGLAAQLERQRQALQASIAKDLAKPSSPVEVEKAVDPLAAV